MARRSSSRAAAAGSRGGRAVARAVAAALCACVAATASPAGASAPQTAPGTADKPASSASEQVKLMQAQVERVAKELGAGAVAYEAGSDRLDKLLQQQFAAERALEAEQDGAAEAQRRLNAVANAAYRHPIPQAWSLAMSVNPSALAQSLENVVTLQRAGVTQRAALEALVRQRASTGAKASKLDGLRQRAQAAQEDLDEQYSVLRTKAAKARAELLDAQQQLARLQAEERQRAARRAAASRTFFTHTGNGGPPCSAPADGQYANGFLPAEVLCELRTAPGQHLTAAAAAAFDRMSEYYRSKAGTGLCVSDSYRSYPEQVDVFERKPSLAATPGSSQHGWGLAVDLCGGAERYDTPVYLWLKANAAQFGWVHPSWAEPGGSKAEPWHWEYTG